MSIVEPQTQLTPEQIAQQMGTPKVNKLFAQAIKYGVINLGWSGVDYLRYSKDNYGWESTAICGIKSSAKSNLMLQRAFSIYQDSAYSPTLHGD